MAMSMRATATMDKKAAMALYGERRQRTAVVQLDRSGSGYKRCDVLAMVDQTVDRLKVEAIGQLQNNWSWEVVFRDETTKKQFVEREDLKVKQRQVTIGDFQRSLQRLRLLRVPICVPNEFLAAKLNAVGATVKMISNEISSDDGLMTNVRIATVECKDIETVPDTLDWSFDGLMGKALLFIQGRPPRCHRCGDRSHKVAQCNAAMSYANAMRGGRDIDDGDMDCNDDDDAGASSLPPPTSQPTDQQPAEATTTATDKQGEGRSDTATAAAPETNMSESDVSDAEQNYGDGETSASEVGGPTVDADGFRQPRSHLRRRKRSKKTSATTGSVSSDTNELPKKIKGPEAASDTERQSTSRPGYAAGTSTSTKEELDPTTGRRNSRSRIPTGRLTSPANTERQA